MFAAQMIAIAPAKYRLIVMVMANVCVCRRQLLVSTNTPLRLIRASISLAFVNVIETRLTRGEGKKYRD